MDSSKDHTTKSHPTVTVTKTSDTDSTTAGINNNHNNNQPSNHQHHLFTSKSKRASSSDTATTKHVRPGEAIMQSDDPSTAALRYVLCGVLAYYYFGSNHHTTCLSIPNPLHPCVIDIDSGPKSYMRSPSVSPLVTYTIYIHLCTYSSAHSLHQSLFFLSFFLNTAKTSTTKTAPGPKTNNYRSPVPTARSSSAQSPGARAPCPAVPCFCQGKRMWWSHRFIVSIMDR